MPDTATSPYFLAGLGAVVCFFATGALVGFGLFAVGEARQKLLRALAILLTIMLVVLAWLGRDLMTELRSPNGLVSAEEPGTTELAGWSRNTLSVLIFGIATVFTSLLSAFSFVRAGQASSGFRCLPWAIVGVKVVLGSFAILQLLSRAGLSPESEESIPHGELAGIAGPVLDETLRVMQWMWPAALTLVVFSAVISYIKVRKEPEPVA
jgi:hypothetical protein